MIKSLLILIERVEQCLTVLTKMYNLIAHYTKYDPDFQPVSPDDIPLADEISVLDVDDGEPLLTIDDACARLGITRGTLRALRQQELLPEVKKGEKGVRFREADVEKLRKWYSIPKGKV